jgi:hypothetical protein
VVPVKWTDPCAVTLGISTKMLRDLLHTLVLVTIFDSLEKNVFFNCWLGLVGRPTEDGARKGTFLGFNIQVAHSTIVLEIF